MLVGHDIDDPIFIVEEDAFNFAYLVFIVDVQFYLLLNVNKKTIVLVWNYENLLKISTLKVLRLGAKWLFEFVNNFRFFRDEIHWEDLLSIAKQQSRPFQGIFFLKHEVHWNLLKQLRFLKIDFLFQHPSVHF